MWIGGAAWQWTVNYIGCFKQDLKEPSEGADRKSGSSEFHTEGTAAEKAPGANYEVTAGFENRQAAEVVWPQIVWQQFESRDGMSVVATSECLAVKSSRPAL